MSHALSSFNEYGILIRRSFNVRLFLDGAAKRILFLSCSWLHPITTVIFQKLPPGQKFSLIHYLPCHSLSVFFLLMLFSVIPSFISCSPVYSPCLPDSDTLAHAFWNVLLLSFPPDFSAGRHTVTLSRPSCSAVSLIIPSPITLITLSYPTLLQALRDT